MAVVNQCSLSSLESPGNEETECYSREILRREEDTRFSSDTRLVNPKEQSRQRYYLYHLITGYQAAVNDQHNFSDHAHGDNRALVPFFNKDFALHWAPDRIYGHFDRLYSEALQETGRSTQLLGPAKRKKIRSAAA